MWQDYIEVAAPPAPQCDADGGDSDSIFGKYAITITRATFENTLSTITAKPADFKMVMGTPPLATATEPVSPFAPAGHEKKNAKWAEEGNSGENAAVFCAACGSRVWTTQARHDEDVYHMTPIKTSSSARLFLGGIWNAENQRELCASGVQTVVSMACEHSKKLFPNTIRYKFFALEDSEEEYALLDFLLAAKFVSDELEGGRNVLVHCAMGRSRSVAAVAAYLVYSNRISARQALNDIRAVRVEANPNDGYKRQLRVIETLLHIFGYHLHLAIHVAEYSSPSRCNVM